MQRKTFVAFFQLKYPLKFAAFNPHDFYSSQYLVTFNVCQVFFKVAKRILWVFLPLISICIAKWPFAVFSLFTLPKISFLRFTQKLRGIKQGRGVIYNETYLEVFSQRSFWYKKVFSKQHFRKTYKVSNVFTSQTWWSLLYITVQTKLRIFRVGC